MFKFLIRPLALGDIAYHDAVHDSAIGALHGGGGQMRPEHRPVIFSHPQIARPRFPDFKDLLAVQVVDVLGLPGDEPAEKLLDQSASVRAQQGRSGKVGLQDLPLLADGAIAHRGQIVQVEIARPRGVQFRLGPAQFVVLHLQFDLMHLEFMEHPPHFFGRQDLDVFRHPGILCLYDLFRLLAQIILWIGWGFLSSHGLSSFSTQGPLWLPPLI